MTKPLYKDNFGYSDVKPNNAEHFQDEYWKNLEVHPETRLFDADYMSPLRQKFQIGNFIAHSGPNHDRIQIDTAVPGFKPLPRTFSNEEDAIHHINHVIYADSDHKMLLRDFVRTLSGALKAQQKDLGSTFNDPQV